MSTYTPPYQLTDAILRLSTEIAATVKEITVRGNLSAQPQLHRANRIRSVHSSLAIEHNSLTLDQVTALLNGKRVLAPQQEVWEVQNAFRAYDLLPSLDPYSIDDLLKVHRIMMDGLVMGAGTFRNTGVGVYAGDQLIHAGTPAQYVPEAMQQLFEWLQNTTAHPLVASCVFHYEFEFIHPFADGNGRTGRLWQTLILRKWEPIFTYLPIESMILEHQADYYAARNDSRSAEKRLCEAAYQVAGRSTARSAQVRSAHDHSRHGGASRSERSSNSPSDCIFEGAKQASSRGFQQDRTLGCVQKVPINVLINVRIETFVSFVTRHTR